MSSRVVSIAFAVALASCVPHHYLSPWYNPSHPRSDSTLALYDCDVSASQLVAAQYPNDWIEMDTRKPKEVQRCMTAHGWGRSFSGSAQVTSNDTVRFHTVPNDTTHPKP